MISFATLFLGLVLGVVDVRLHAGAGVETVDLLLDGKPVAELRAPFAASVDLGCEPAPHALLAIARDAGGREVGRARQWVNRPRNEAEAGLVLEAGRGGEGRVARLSWSTLVAEEPEAVDVSLDGAPVEVHDPRRVALPPFEPARAHFLRALLDFGKGVTASAELVFGGSTSVETEAELTAVAVELEKGVSLPEPAALSGWFEADGAPLAVAAVEVGGADVVLVAEESARRELRRAYELESRYGCRVSDARGAVGARGGEGEEIRYRVVWPVPTSTPQTDLVANVYPMTRWFERGRASLDWIAGCRLEWPKQGRSVARIADAVAVAGLVAAQGGRRRAVVLILGSEAKDGSRLAPEESARFLERLAVPLRVAAVGMRRSPEAARWAAARPVALERRLAGPLAKLEESLARQRVVWVEGAHLPQAVSATPLARGVRLAR